MSYTSILSAEKDPMGSALKAYQENGKADKIRVFSSQFDEDEMLPKDLFRSFSQMPELEKEALLRAHGRILDVGAGSGCHALALQNLIDKNDKDAASETVPKSVTAIDHSPLSVEVMKKRGIQDARAINLFDPTFTEAFDTILLLMNGAGIAGRIAQLPRFFQRLNNLLAPNGQIFMDSSDLKFLFEEEDGSYYIDLAGDYYGEVDFQMQYQEIKGDLFYWLYIDFQTLSLYASQCGFQCELITEGEHYNYLARLTRI